VKYENVESVCAKVQASRCCPFQRTFVITHLEMYDVPQLVDRTVACFCLY
jgi:hypothetical protein